jgi:YidC/Oxa1 family membrane protein insertase
MVSAAACGCLLAASPAVTRGVATGSTPFPRGTRTVFDSVIFGSIFDPLYQLLSTIVTWFYKVVPNYAIAIGLLTLAIMIAVLPLTLKSTKSMLEMQVLQPQVKQLQQQHKGDRQAMNEALMALYKEHKVNPLGGCVPMLLPLPVFIVMYRTIRGLIRTCTDGLLKADIFKDRAGLKVGQFCPQHLKSGSKLFEDLVGKTKMNSFLLDLSKPAATQIRDSFVHGLPYLLLVLVVAVTSYYQQRQMTVRMKDQPVNSQQQMLMRVMPAMFAVFSLFFPAALIVYFLVQNVFRIGQNAYITHRFYGDGGLAAAARTAAAAAKAETGDKPERGPKGQKASKPERPASGAGPTSGNRSARPERPAPSDRARPVPPSRANGGRTTPPKSSRPSTPRPQPRPKPKDR